MGTKTMVLDKFPSKMKRESLEDVTASTSSPLMDDAELFHEITSICDVAGSFAHLPSPSTLSTDVCSPSYSVPRTGEAVGLTPDEAAELLKALETAEPPQTLAQQTVVCVDAVAPFSAPKSENQRRKPGRKKAQGPSAGKMRNPSRERLQNELAYLRKKVVELEGQLRGLQFGNRSNWSLWSSKQNPIHDLEAGARVWQRIAQRQAQGRDEAEAENRRLKAVLEGQIHLAQRLEQVLQKRPNVSVLGDGQGVPMKRLCLGAEDPTTMYERFLGELDGLYAQTDEVFQQNGLETSVDDTLRHAYVKTRSGSDGQDELYAELQDVNIIPFEFERVSAALWYAVKRQYSKHQYHSYQGLRDRVSDTIAVKYRTKCLRRGLSFSLDAIMVMRQYVDRDRMAIVWRSVSRREDEPTGMYTDETGWSVLKRIPPDSGLALSGCVMHNCVHIVPKRMGSPTGMQSDEIGLLTNLVINSYEDDVIALSTMIEDLLLQDSATGGSWLDKAR